VGVHQRNIPPQLIRLLDDEALELSEPGGFGPPGHHEDHFTATLGYLLDHLEEDLIADWRETVHAIPRVPALLERVHSKSLGVVYFTDKYWTLGGYVRSKEIYLGGNVEMFTYRIVDGFPEGPVRVVDGEPALEVCRDALAALQKARGKGDVVLQGQLPDLTFDEVNSL